VLRHEVVQLRLEVDEILRARVRRAATSKNSIISSVAKPPERRSVCDGGMTNDGMADEAPRYACA
jgi:hypothetical protein